ncbi:MAG: hypothetical protein Q4C68_07220, partial [Moraxella sp.]|nr:hypothetical protein [Moraxella sp.]
TFQVKSNEKVMMGGERVGLKIPTLPNVKINPTDLILEYLHADGTPIYGAKYTVTFSDGSKKTGILDEKGQALIKNAPSGDATVEYELAMQK